MSDTPVWWSEEPVEVFDDLPDRIKPVTTVDIGTDDAVVIARAVDRIVEPFQQWATADVVQEYLVDGLVALVSEGWQLIPPGELPATYWQRRAEDEQAKRWEVETALEAVLRNRPELQATADSARQVFKVVTSDG